MSLTFSWPSSMIFCGLRSLCTTKEVCTGLSVIYDMRLLLRVVQMLSWWVKLSLGVYWLWIFRSLKTSSLFLHLPRILELNNTTYTQIYLLLLLVFDDLLELCDIGMVKYLQYFDFILHLICSTGVKYYVTGWIPCPFSFFISLFFFLRMNKLYFFIAYSIPSCMFRINFILEYGPSPIERILRYWLRSLP